jgi:cysteine synthase A
MIPGLGASIRPPLLDESYVDEVVRVEEADTIRTCHRLARRGFLFGGSTGTVVWGAMGWLAQHHTRALTAVAIAPDLGERYLDTIYQATWLHDLYGQDVLSPGEPDADSRPPGLPRLPGLARPPGLPRPRTCPVPLRTWHESADF